MDFLCETALLTHGLRSISQEELRQSWPFQDDCLVWVDHGRIVRGSMEQYLPFRDRGSTVYRIDYYMLKDALAQGISGALTASGTMAVCEKLGISLAVSCGIGGLGDIKGEELCPDLPALRELPVALLAASPKDMLDIPGTLHWLLTHGVHVAGPACTGYVFRSTRVELEETLEAYSSAEAVRGGIFSGGLLLLHPIPEVCRIADLSILKSAILAGKRAEQENQYFHPAANGEIDRLTDGYSSHIQLDGLIANAVLASNISETCS